MLILSFRYFVADQSLRSLRPSPSGSFGAVNTVLVRIRPASDLAVAEFFLGVSPNLLELGDAIDRVNCQAEAVDFVIDRQFHGRVDVAFFLVSAHVKRLVPPAIRQAVDQPGVAVEIEYDRFVRRKQRIKIVIGQPMGVFGARLQLKQVDDIDKTNLESLGTPPVEGWSRRAPPVWGYRRPTP